jgi:hypothetical protein
MYDVNDLHFKESHQKTNNAPIFRVLLEQDGSNNNTENTANSSNNEPTTNNNTSLNEETSNDSNELNPQENNSNPNYKNDPTQTIHINGMGVAGIGVSILFLIPVLIGCFVMMGIFVNTKFIDQPIRIKIME